MNEEEINRIFENIPTVTTTNCISSYVSIDVDNLRSAMKRLDKVPSYNDLQQENKQLQEKLDKLNAKLTDFLCTEYYCAQGKELAKFCEDIKEIIKGE